VVNLNTNNYPAFVVPKEVGIYLVFNYLKSRLARIYTARHLAKRLIIGVVGFTILAIGVVMMVLPGPAFIVIPIGVGILATEFAWAKRLLRKVEEKLRGQTRKTEYKEESKKRNER
jgi:uncharacterized protein (TIGR02611 family)